MTQRLSKTAGVSVVTLNKLGRTTTELNEINELFVEAARRAARPVLDLGCAMGVATLAALEAGAHVFANDVDLAHLEVVERSTPPKARPRLHLTPGRFPDDLDFEPSSFDAIHASNLLNFLTGEQIDRGFEAIYKWLAPGGTFLSISGSPYAANIKGFIPDYEAAIARGVAWPGFCHDLSAYSDDATILELPKQLHLLDPDVLAHSAEKAGLKVEEACFFNRRGIPDYIKLDGRENVVLVASKKE